MNLSESTPPPSPVRQVTDLWWVYLIFGIVWILFGMWLWSYRVGSLVALAVLIGVTIMFSGITEIMIGLRLPAFRWLVVAAGALSIVAGFLILIWPGPTLYIIAIFLGWFLFVIGIVHIVEAFARVGQSYWWVQLIQGGIEFLLGAWARGDHTRSLFLFINLAGAFAVVRGISEIFAAFELRRAGGLSGAV
jgi:uncharacterized membrane protein HdeD (DUF308 family)